MISLPWVVLKARQMSMEMEFLTNWTWPSIITEFTPPGCRLREPMNSCLLPPLNARWVQAVGIGTVGGSVDDVGVRCCWVR